MGSTTLVGMAIESPEGDWVEVNGKLCEIYGYPCDELMKKHWKDFTYPEDLNKDLENFQRIQRGEIDRYSLEKRYIRKDGEVINCLISVACSRHPDSQLAAIYIAVIDITTLRRVEEELRKTLQELVIKEERLKRAQEIAHLGSWELDVESNTLFWSDEVYRIFGLNPQEFEGTYEGFLDTVHPEDRAAVDTAYSGSIRDGKDIYEIEHRVVRKSTGEIRYVCERCQHIKDEAGKVIRSTGMVHDITEQKKAEESLRSSEEKYRTIFEQAADSIVLVDAETGKIEQFNSMAHENLGYTREEFAKLKISDFEFLESKEKVASHIKKIVLEGADIFETQQRTKSGIIRDIQVNARAIRISGKQFLHSIWRDITERKQAELKEKQYTEDLLTLSKVAAALAELLPSEDIFKVIAEQVQQLARGIRFVIVSSFNESANLFRVQALSGNQSDISALSSILGQNLLGLDTPISIEGRTALTSGSLQRAPGGLFDLAAGLITRTTAGQIEESFGINSAYAMGFYWQGKLFGSLNILMAKGYELQNPNLIETFVRQVAVALQRKQAMDNLATAKEELETRVAERTRELRELSHRLVDAQEKERALIGRELHDEIGQYMTYATLLLDRAARKPDPQALAEAKTTVQEAISRIRNLSTMLSPRLLRSAGLTQALFSLSEEYTQRTNIKVDFDITGTFDRLPADVALAGYRIVQEALTNVARHAKASEVKVKLSCESSRLYMEVVDNGIGFDFNTVKHSAGLAGMKERALALGGEFHIEPKQGQGTRIIAGIPLS